MDFLIFVTIIKRHLEDVPGIRQKHCALLFPDVPAFLVVTVTGLTSDEEVSFTHATLLGVKGDVLQQVKLNSSSSSLSYSLGELVGVVDSVPRVPFSVGLAGKDSRGNKLERVSTEMVQPTHVQIQVIRSRV